MWGNDEIEYVLEHLAAPERLLDEDFVEWLKEAEHRALFEEVRNHREAFLRWQKEGRMDVESEYCCFSRRMKTRRKMARIRRWAGVAACLAVIAGAGILLERKQGAEVVSPEYASLTGKRSAELILSDGQRISLENRDLQLKDGKDVLITNDSSLQLVYRQDSIRPADDSSALLYNTLRVPAGADYVVTLSDSTRVRLNCGTEFRYPVKFAGRERRVYLDGEAFFEVQQAGEWPFIVEASRMHVRVTGTEFNVKAYHSEEMMHTTLVRGAVTVMDEEHDGQEVRLHPSQQCRMDKHSGEVSVEEVDVRLFTGWVDGMFVFKDQRLEEVMNMLARWYQIEVFYATPSVKDWRLSANLGRYEHIDTILRMLRAMNKIEAVRKGNVITVSWK